MTSPCYNGLSDHHPYISFSSLMKWRPHNGDAEVSSRELFFTYLLQQYGTEEVVMAVLLVMFPQEKSTYSRLS